MWRNMVYIASIKRKERNRVVEVILILVGILTTYYRVSIRCMK